MNWQIFQDIMVGVACGSQPGLQGLPMLVVYEQQKKGLSKLEEIKQAMQNREISPAQSCAGDSEEILDVLPADEIPYVYPDEGK